MATLYIVSTPIGNLEDITLRALRVLKEVDLILCEDTRVTRGLLAHYDIHTKTESYHAQSSLGKTDHIIRMLEGGANIALVSDAGTPTVSDPGSMLVVEIRERVKDADIVTVPGASALLAAVAGTTIPTSSFVFLGFLPHKKGRETLFKEIAISRRSVVFYESVHRIEKTIDSLVLALGPTRKICIARELTKLYEERIEGTPEYVQNYFKEYKEKIRGEFVVIVSPV